MISRDAAEAILAAHRVRTAGAPLSRARAAVVTLHGRGADAASILGLTDALAQPDVAFLAPEASGRAWYPQSFIAPIAQNEPWLSRSLAQVAALLDALADAGVPEGKAGLMGFSQGACLALETAIRRPRPYGGVIALSGGYIGPMGAERTSEDRLDGAKVFLGCSDIDPHIPLQRVEETAQLMASMGADVTRRIYPGFGHAVNDDEVAAARGILSGMTAR
jgi:phospholipase/carboxylesterase